MFKQRVHITRNNIHIIISLITLSPIGTPHIAELNHPPYRFIYHHVPDLIFDISALPPNLLSSDLYSSLSLILDTHATEITKTVISRPNSSWYTLKHFRLGTSSQTKATPT